MKTLKESLQTVNESETIDTIADFRSKHKGKAISTTHNFSIKDFSKISNDLFKKYKSFDVEYDKNYHKGAEYAVRITIPFRGNPV